MELAKFMFKLNNQSLPENFHYFSVSVSAIYKYDTKINQKDKKFISRERTTFVSKNLNDKYVKIWNN